jgi:hypothetical protein
MKSSVFASCEWYEPQEGRFALKVLYARADALPRLFPS